MSHVTKTEKVLVLEVQARASLPIMESCAAMGLYVVGGSHKRHCCGLYSRAVDERLLYPSVEIDPNECAKFLLEFIRKRPVSVLFPVGDVMTDLIARRQAEFRNYTRFVLPPYEVFIQGRNKILTLKAADWAKCPIPKTWFPKDQSIDSITNEVDYPVLIKPAVSAGARGITFCYSRDELLENFTKVQANFGESFVQELIPQGGTQYKVDVVLDDSQRLLAGVVYEKLRYYPPNGGSSVLNKTVYRPDILESALKVLNELKWVGFCDFDFVGDPRDGVVKLVEINPRYPESYRATVAAGVDMTKLIYQLAKGEKPPPQLEYLENRYLRFLFGDIMWFLTTKDNRWGAKPSFFKFFGSDMMYQILRAKDFGPIVGYILENLIILADRKARKNRLRLGNR